MQKRPTVAFSVSVTGTLRGTWLLNSPDNRCDFRNDFRCDFHCDTDRCGSRYIYQWDTHAFTPRFCYFLSVVVTAALSPSLTGDFGNQKKRLSLRNGSCRKEM